ncbi:hypothetical protein ACFY93_02190 [Streptomyces sp. NPDC008313]|uniref:hypothetical protein n=1 Tax=Streptomyces sp. NPDC008313 TaxID=3364826 RepID=UPI0036E00007
MPASERDEAPRRVVSGVPMRELLASCAAAAALSTPPPPPGVERTAAGRPGPGTPRTAAAPTARQRREAA